MHDPAQPQIPTRAVRIAWIVAATAVAFFSYLFMERVLH